MDAEWYDDGYYCIHLNHREKCEVKCSHCGHPCHEHHEGGHCVSWDDNLELFCGCDLFVE